MAKTDPFAKALKLIDDTAKANSMAYKGEFAIAMVQRFARDTPVKDGHATGNWVLKGGSPNLTHVTFTDKTVTASPTVNRARDAYKDIKLKEVVYISNAVQGEKGEGYIIGLEHGKSRQAPNGMFKINVVQAAAISKQAIKKAME